MIDLNIIGMLAELIIVDKKRPESWGIDENNRNVGRKFVGNVGSGKSDGRSDEFNLTQNLLFRTQNIRWTDDGAKRRQGEVENRDLDTRGRKNKSHRTFGKSYCGRSEREGE